jgi:hypothetical protein
MLFFRFLGFLSTTDKRKFMTTPLLELEGTWEEIGAQLTGFYGQKIHMWLYIQ